MLFGADMLRMMKSVALGVSFAAMLSVVPLLSAQQYNDQIPDDQPSVKKPAAVVPSAPVPSAIQSAKKIFIANGAEGSNVPFGIYGGDDDRAYNEFYEQMKGWGHYELAPSPADAELVLEITFQAPLIGHDVFAPQFHIDVLDVKTHTLLWKVVERVPVALLQSNREKNFDQTIGALVDDIKKLAGPPPASSSGK
jgi:hypothetical protein